MKMTKRNKIAARLFLALYIIISGIGFTISYLTITDKAMQIIMFFIITLLGGTNALFFVVYRKKYIQFSDTVCDCTEKILRQENCDFIQNQETLSSKMVMELEKVKTILEAKTLQAELEKSEIQSVVSDIAHQLKIPITNIYMYQDMLSDSEISEEERERFTNVLLLQISKLEFLADTLIKSSRLEADMITLHLENTPIFETLALAMNTIAGKAEKKKIEITVDCRPSIYVVHDTKWTAEALENILDNAVKYTPDKGKVMVSVHTGEMYMEIKIKDTGKGMEISHLNDIFKRFYREKSSAKIDGLGLGLYIARNIISLQGGYIMVRSRSDKGSCFSIFLPNKNG